MITSQYFDKKHNRNNGLFYAFFVYIYKKLCYNRYVSKGGTMITTKQAKEFAQIAWDTGTYLNGVGYYYIELPDYECTVSWKLNTRGDICKLQIQQQI